MCKDTGREAEIARRMAAVNEVYMSTPQTDEAAAIIEATRARRRQNGKAFCSLITGPSGVGKTRIFERYLARQPVPDDPSLVPVLLMSATNGAESEFFNAILAALGEPILAQSPEVIKRRTNLTLKRRGTEVLLLEEASHIVDKKATDAKTPYKVTDAVKAHLLDGPYPVPVVMNGIPVAKRIFEINSQLETRRFRTLTLTTFDYRDEKSRDSFELLVQRMEKKAGFKEAFFGEEDLVRRLHHATGGLPAKVAKLLMDATGLAVENGAEGFTRAILAEACAKGADDPGPRWTNSFLVPVLKPLKVKDETRPTGLHRRGRREE